MHHWRGEAEPVGQASGQSRVEGLGGLVGCEEYAGCGKRGNDDAAHTLVESPEDIGRRLLDGARACKGLEVVLALVAGLDGV